MALDEEKIKGILKEKGLKVTRQRLVVLNALASKPDSHLTAEEIYDLVKTDSPEIGWLLFIEQYSYLWNCI